MGERILFVFFLIFAFTAAIQFYYYLYFYLAPYSWEPPEIKSEGKPVSVIICARNEAENLKKLLPSVLEQDYPDYEVIVVNDCSEDDTYKVLGELIPRYPHLRISTLNKDPKFTHNKKLAQFIGIKAAKNQVLLFTDADCMPESNKWLEGMTCHFQGKTDYVLGYGGYLKEDGMLNTFIRTDTVMIAMQYLGMAIRGIPYMAVGRNLAYRRSEFFNNNGFGIHSNLASGDDDLFINNNAKPGNTIVEFRPGTHTASVPSPSFSEWKKQKKRHLTTAPYYKPSHKFLLVTEPLSRMIFYSLFIVLLAFHYLWIEVLVIFGVRMVTQTTVYSLVQRKLQERGLVVYSLFFDIFSPVINSFLYLGSKKGQAKNQWR
jgi:glycosyltransferase involved in cell wall biosynthesis